MCNMKNVDNYNNLKQIMRSLNKIIQRDISFDLLRFTEVVKMI